MKRAYVNVVNVTLVNVTLVNVVNALKKRNYLKILKYLINKNSHRNKVHAVEAKIKKNDLNF